MGVEPGEGGRPFLARRIGDDADFRRRVEASEKLGIPLSKFEGRQPDTTTEYEYERGVLVRSVTTTEPEWTEHDQAVILALAQYRESLCDCCGLPKSMTLVDEREAPTFIVTKKYCLARRTLIESQQSFTNNGKETKPAHAALLWSIRVRP